MNLSITTSDACTRLNLVHCAAGILCRKVVVHLEVDQLDLGYHGSVGADHLHLLLRLARNSQRL